MNDDPEALAYLGQAYARAGQRDEAQKILAHLREEAKSRYVSGYSIALMFMGLGDKEQAIDALEQAYREGAGNDLFTIRVDPMLDDLRGQPRFEALAEKILPAAQFGTKPRQKNENRQFLRRAEAAQRLQGRGRVCGRRMALAQVATQIFPVPGNSELGCAFGDRIDRNRIPNCARHRVGVRSDAGRN